MKRHPLSIDVDKFLDSDQGRSAEEPSTLGAGEPQRQFIRNRLRHAFKAGWDAAEQRMLKTLKTHIEEKKC